MKISSNLAVTASNIQDIASTVIKKWLGKDYLPLVDTLKAMDWKLLPVADFINPMEAEWLADAVGEKPVVGLSFDFEGILEIEVFEANRDSLIEYNVTNSHQYICLTSEVMDFLYFKDDENRFYLLCGDEDFIRSSYRCSRDTAKVMYLEHWVESDFNNDNEKRFLIQIWEKYSI